MNKKRLRTSMTGIAISLSLLSGTSLAVAKPAVWSQEFALQQPLSSLAYISTAKELPVNANRFTFAPKKADERKVEQAQPIKAEPLEKAIAAPINSVPVDKTIVAPINSVPFKKTIAAPTQKPEIKHETKQKDQPIAAAPANAPKQSKLQQNTSTQAHTLEISPGKTVQYNRLIPVKATAYTAAAEENGAWGAFDYFGNPLKTGTVAVDPNVIPLGSTLYITGYQYNGLPAKGMIAKATDTGSAIKGKRIDIFVPSSREDASQFGMQDVKVYIMR